MGVFDYKRRKSSEAKIGNVTIGGENPVMLQSMTNTSTNDIEGSLTQIKNLGEAGAALVRLTAQGQREVDSLREIKARLKEEGNDIPIVADIHFNTAAAFAAAEVVDKVRINPGNFVDPGRVFRKIEYTDEEYARQLEELTAKVEPFFRLCRERGVAVRIGVNHGSLSDRIMSRYGDTPEGMVESAMEFLRIARNTAFSDITISIKSSNTSVMVQTVRKLVAAMDSCGMNYPLHLGVTEAGEGEDGRIKSAIGIGALLTDGIGDTIRVSLSEDPVNEIPVAREITDYITSREGASPIQGHYYSGFDKENPSKRPSEAVGKIGGDNQVAVIVEAGNFEFSKDNTPDFTSTNEFIEINADNPVDDVVEQAKSFPHKPLLLTSGHHNRIGAVKRAIHALTEARLMNPIAVKLSYPADLPQWKITVRAAVDFGSLLLDRLVDGIMIDAPGLDAEELGRLSFGILQGAGTRITKTEYIACPGCGRTLFNLSPTLARVKEATKHLKGMKIGVMGCIVNGPGEMADADYGYVGAGKGRITLYRGKEAVEKNIPQEEAVDRLIELMKRDGRWTEPLKE